MEIRSIVAAVFLFSGMLAALADPWPLKEKQTFLEARRALLLDGWKPVETFDRLDDGAFKHSWGDAGPLYRHGFKEVADCTGTGSDGCFYNYRKGSRCMLLITEGEYLPPASPTVDNWWTYPAPGRNGKSPTASLCSEDAAHKAGFFTSPRKH